jgi:hypothetical protein
VPVTRKGLTLDRRAIEYSGATAPDFHRLPCFAKTKAEYGQVRGDVNVPRVLPAVKASVIAERKRSNPVSEG